MSHSDRPGAVASLIAVPGAASAAVCTSAPPGLIARWPGDGTATDVAHGRDGTLVGGTAFAGGEVGQAFSFDGVNDTVSVPDNPDWSLPGDFTIDTWVKFTGFHGLAQALVAQDEGFGNTAKWMFWYAEGGDLAFEFGATGWASMPPKRRGVRPSRSGITWRSLAPGPTSPSTSTAWSSTPEPSRRQSPTRPPR